MLKILLNTIVVILVVLLSSFKIKAQQVIHDNIITLSNPDQGNKVYMADERVEFLPGYEFDANSSDKMEAFIEKSMSYTDLYTTNDFNSLQLDVNKDIGSMPGQFDVMGNGAASYVFPIELPKGVNGFQPNLSLGYNSFNSNDILGMGWNLNGLSIIKVSKQQLFRDGESRGVLLDGTDMFELDNTRLYAENGSYGSDGTTYSTEVDNFSRITSHGNGVTPNYFTLETKDGIIIEYGKSKNSFIDNDNQTKVIYGINKMIDQNGNVIEFLYENVVGEIRIKEIKYGGHSSGITDQIIRIKFNYQQRQDINTLYYGGVPLIKNSVLKDITITKSNQIVYSYDFEYGYNSTSFLKTVTKKAGNDELNPIHFKYGESQNEYPLETTRLLQFNQYSEVYNGGDYNGDGLNDLFVKEFEYDEYANKVYNKWVVYKNRGDNSFDKFAENLLPSHQKTYDNGYIQQISRQTQHNHDFTGNGRTDILTYQVIGNKENGFKINNFEIFEFNENGTISKTFTVELGSITQEYFDLERGLHIGDFTGNGLSDIIVMTFNENDMVYHGLLVNFELTEYKTHFLNLEGLKYLNAAHDIVLGDFNGDGKTDVSVLYTNSLQIFDFERSETGANSYNENKIAHNIKPFSSDFSNHSECKLLPADFNGDGNTDYLVYKANGEALVTRSNGLNELLVSFSFNFKGKPSPNNEIYGDGLFNIWHSGLRVTDVNKDGKSDIIHFYRKSGFQDDFIDLYTMSDAQFKYDGVTQELTGRTDQILSDIPFMDFNGDGNFSLFDRVPLTSTAKIRSFSKLNNTSNLLTNIKDEFLNEIQINYEFLPQDEDYNHMNNPPNSTGYVLRDFVPSIPIVKSVLSPSSIGLLDNEVNYKYRGGKAGFRGVGFLGFMENETIDEANEKKQVSEKTILRSSTQTAHPNLFVPFEFKKTVLDFDNEIITEKMSTPNLTVFSGLRYDLEITNTTDIDYLNDTELVNHYLYDNSGNLTEELSLLYSNNSLVQTVTSEFSYDHFGTSLGFNNKLTQQKVTVSKPNVQDDFTTIETFDYHPGNGNLTKKKSQVNTPFEVTEEYNYNFFGNMIKTTTKTVGFEDRVSRTVYDFNGRLPIKTINELGQEATIQYHPLFDKPVQITDADGLISTSTYDNFGRLTSTVDKYGLVSTIQKEWVNTNPSTTSGNSTQADDIMYKVIESRQGEPDKTVHYNRLGQQRMQEIQGLTDPIFSVTTYNNKGQVIASTEPFFQGASNISLTETVYDDYNRVSNVTNNGETVSYTYALENGLQKTTTTNPDFTTHTAHEDASGNLIKSEDDGGLTEFSYFSHGGVKEIKVNSEVVATSEYDVLGRQTKLIDVNAGTVEYEYNAFGDVIETVNANGEVKTYTYDDYGRLEQTNNNGIIVNYEYVETGNGINEIEKISTNDHEELFEYDGLNRVVKTTEIISGNSFEFEYVYNNLNQAEQIIYPNGLVVNNIYDNNGYLIEVKDQSNNSLWQGLAQDALGRFVEYKKGDNVTTELFYDAFQNLAEIDAGNVQHHVYNWNDETGNLSYRKDLVKQLEEDFEYDNLNRLTKATASPIGSELVLNSLEMDYAPNGNIIDKSDAGEYTYHTSKHNAVTNVTNDNQNISLLTQDISYNAMNKASSITEGDYTLQFLYGHDKHRRLTTFYDENGLAMEKYFVGLYEKEIDHQTGITRHVNYITAGDGMTAIVLQEEENSITTEETYFTYKDHLGSIIALTNNTGSVVLEQSFDSWGRYRNPNNWTFINVTEQPTWLRGFTGHEHLPHFDLINMNGRIYDPILGRMLSPDRYVQDPLSSQSYNRYSYVWNNPLRYTDPSGELALLAIAGIGAAVFGTTNLIIQASRGEVNNFGDGAKAFGAGAIAGAAITAGVATGLGLPILGSAIKGAGIIYGGTAIISTVSGLGYGIFSGDWSRLANTGKLLAGNFYLDGNRSFLGQTWQGISRFSWELPQTTIGHGYSQLRNAFGGLNRVDYFGGATFATGVKPNYNFRWGVSIGNFINIKRPDDSFDILNDPLLMHEYGHTFDSQIFGLSYLLAIGIPSLSGANWTEYRANRHAARYFEKHHAIDWTEYILNYPLEKP